MSKRLIIHIGTHKTGSTSIQRATRLLAAKRGSGVTDISTPMRVFLASLCSADDRTFQQSRAALEDALASLTKEGRTNIWSSEGLVGDPYLGYPSALRCIERLGPVAKDYDATCVVFFRRQDSYIESLYKQSLHEGKPHTAADFIDTLPLDRLCWNSLAKGIETAFGSSRAKILTYFTPGNNGVVERFLAVAGLTCQADSEPVENIGFTAAQAEIARLVNATMSEPERKRLRWLFQRCNQLATAPRTGLLPRTAHEEFANMFREPNRELALRYWPDATDHWTFQKGHELPVESPVTSSDLVIAMAQLIAVMPAETEYWTSGEPITLRWIRRFETGLRNLLRGAQAN